MGSVRAGPGGQCPSHCPSQKQGSWWTLQQPQPGASGRSLGMGQGWAKAGRDVRPELGLGPGMGRAVRGVGSSGQASWEAPHTKAAPPGWGWPRASLPPRRSSPGGQAEAEQFPGWPGAHAPYLKEGE